MYVWLNIDFPEKKATLHINTCRHVLALGPTEFKGVGKMKRDGGWMPFESNAEAEEYIRSQLVDRPSVRFAKCGDCQP